MKRILSLMLVVALVSVFVVVPASAAGEPIYTMSFTNAEGAAVDTVEVGETFWANIYVKNVDTIDTLQFMISFDADVVNLLLPNGNTLTGTNQGGGTYDTATSINTKANYTILADYENIWEDIEFAPFTKTGSPVIGAGFDTWKYGFNANLLFNQNGMVGYPLTAEEKANGILAVSVRFKAVKDGDPNFAFVTSTNATATAFIATAGGAVSQDATLPTSVADLTVGSSAPAGSTLTIAANGADITVDGAAYTDAIAGIEADTTKTIAFTVPAGKVLSSVTVNGAAIPAVNATSFDVTISEDTEIVFTWADVVDTKPAPAAFTTFAIADLPSAASADAIAAYANATAKAQVFYATLPAGVNAANASAAGLQITDPTSGNSKVLSAANFSYNGKFGIVVFGAGIVAGTEYAVTPFIEYIGEGRVAGTAAAFTAEAK